MMRRIQRHFSLVDLGNEFLWKNSHSLKVGNMFILEDLLIIVLASSRINEYDNSSNSSAIYYYKVSMLEL
jgi:hypothetical protein